MEEPDIDIEENEIMYPRIENIYSNAVRIKSEPLEYEDNEYVSMELARYDAPESCMPYKNKIILGSKPSTTFLYEEENPENSQNQDLEHYCEQCKMSFSSQNHLDTHKMTIHSLLVARPIQAIKGVSASSSPVSSDSNSQDSVRSRQKAVKSTAKSSILNRTFPLKNTSKRPKDDTLNASVQEANTEAAKEVDSSDGLLCNHCDARFPNEIALIKHTYELLPETQYTCDICDQSFHSALSAKQHRKSHYRRNLQLDPQMKGMLFLRCKFCSAYFKSSTGLKDHTLVKHKSSECDENNFVPFDHKCVFCNRNYMTTKIYNSHLLKKHAKAVLTTREAPKKQAPKKQAPKKQAPGCGKYFCTLCKISFPTQYSAYKHRMTKHPGQGHIAPAKSKDPKPKPGPAKSKPKPQKSKSEQLFKLSKNVEQGAPIPKGTLFKCNKCQIHFVTCSTALEHSKRCVLAKGDWKCNKCRKSFTHQERHIHTLQHDISEKFKVLTVHEKLISKVLCNCPKCGLHYDETNFWKHVSVGCGNESSDCHICSLKFHPESYVKHRGYHTKYSYSKSDFIIIDFVDTVPSKALEVSEEKSQKLPSFRYVKRKFSLYYCKFCKIYMKMVRDRASHLAGKCVQGKQTMLCRRCGLSFTPKSMTRHKPLCTDQVTVHDYTIIRLQDDNHINPPMPEFYHCVSCDFRSLTKKTHQCDLISKKCSVCPLSFDLATYKIHKDHHEYQCSSGIKQTQLYYACVSCKYGFEAYDDLVEHCQKHYLDSTETLEAKTCEPCGLDYPKEHCHSTYDTFEILKFDFGNFFTDKWLDGFGSMSSEKVSGILARSVYGEVRGVKLHLNICSNSDHQTIYQCAQCERYYSFDDVVPHYTRGMIHGNSSFNCSSHPALKCSKCPKIFESKVTKNEDLKLHEIYGDYIPYRVMLFNKNEDKRINEALFTHKKWSLKFRKCHYCNLLISTLEYNSHISSHEMDNDQWEVGKEAGVVGCRLLIPSESEKKLYTVYQCFKCEASIMVKFNVHLHSCSRNTKVQCEKCSLWFLGCSISKHLETHQQLPNFVKKNIAVIKFVKDEVSKSGRKSRRSQSLGDEGEAPASETPNGEETSDLDRTITPVGLPVRNSAQIKYERELNQNPIKLLDEMPQTQALLFYQCKRCYRIVCGQKWMVEHQLACSEALESPFTCNLCDTTYHPSLLEFHAQMHKMIDEFLPHKWFSRYTLTTNSVDVNNSDRWLYKCVPCDVHYLNSKSFDYHFKRNHLSLVSIEKCGACGLRFTLPTLKKHENYHHKYKAINDFNICEVEVREVKTGEIQLTYGFPPGNTEDRENVADVSDDQNADLSPAKIVDATEPTVLEEVDTSKTVEANDIKHVLYKCTECSIHYFSNRTLFNHIIVKKHKENGASCPLCGLCFGKGSVDKHLQMHHWDDGKVSDIEIRVFKEMREDVNDGKVDDGSIDKDNLPLVSQKVDKKIKLYQCKDCNVCVERPRIKFHVCCSDLQKRHCLKCRLSFRWTDLSHHRRLHKQRNLSKNFVIKKFGHRRTECRKVYKCDQCSVHFMSLTALEWHMNAMKHNTKSEKCDKCGLLFGKYSLCRHKYVHHKKLLLANDQLDVVCVSKQKKDTNDRIDDARSVSNSQNVRKFYKCTECDVYFLTQIAYYQHIYNHATLDATEYIACKVCDMQFLNETLSVHMKSHRDKTFCLDKLIVEEYRPVKTPRIETYFANDLNSKVSTTTDDKIAATRRNSGEQLGTVDSTIVL